MCNLFNIINANFLNFNYIYAIIKIEPFKKKMNLLNFYF